MALCMIMLTSQFIGPICVFAETSADGTTVDLTSVINVTNDVVAPPETTMNFSITSGTAVPGSSGILPIYAGIGTPTITPSVTFTTADYVAGTSPVAKTASKTVTVDFSSVSFTRTGIYRYVVTQTTSSTIENMQYANNMYIDVYVTTDGTALSATYVVSDATTSAKGTSFVNTYPVIPGSITITNTVTGNQRELDKEFNYTLTVTSSNTITVTKTDTEGHDTIINLSDGEYNFSLKDSEYATLDGLTNGNVYSVVQESEVVEGYTTTHKIGGGPSIDGFDTGDIVVSGTPKNVDFFNNRDCGTPTGVTINITPYITMLLMTGVLVFFMISKHKKEEEYEG